MRHPLGTLLDFNGVLVDDEPLHHAAFEAVLAPRGIALPWGLYLSDYLALDDEGVAHKALGARGPAPEAEVRALLREKRDAYRRLADERLRFYPGAAEFVRQCAAGGPVVIVSGALRDEIEDALARLGVRDAVAAIVSADDTTACKPDPQGYLLGLDALGRALASGRPAAGVVAVEDSPGGVRAARAAGVAVAALLHTVDEAPLYEAGAGLVAPSLAELTPARLGALAWAGA
ncbi:MAG TPA: HAD family phosphatase [Polyangiaceae bacterium]|nr:HAD family phosphatase [Polyangiaceae bacterium]